MFDIRKMATGLNIDKLLVQSKELIKDNLPMIFSVSAIGCFGMALYETAKATHKSDMEIAAEEQRRAVELPLYENTQLSNVEKVNLCWRNYVKPAMFTLAGTGLVLASERSGHEKYLAVLSAYELTKKANEDRKGVEVDILGTDKAKEIDQAVQQRALKRIDVEHDIQTTSSAGEKILFVEPFTNTPVYATYEDVLYAFNQVNHRRHKYGNASINDLLEALGCRKEMVASDWGWNEDQDLIEPDLSSTRLVDDDPTKPATVIGYSIEPQYDYGTDKNQWR